MKVQFVEVNISTVDVNDEPLGNVKMEVHNWDTHDVKSLTTNANGRGKVLMMPCNSLKVRWYDPVAEDWFSQRVHVQYDIRRPGTPHNHKKIDVTLVMTEPERL